MLMAGVRFVIAGGLMFAWLRWRGAPLPTWREWRGAGSSESSCSVAATAG